jgi:dipeptidyl aminopeptidase/acylaminoacyl peptidase
MRAVLRRLSPISNIARITRPLLVVQGKNDREIPLAQSEELVAVARSRSIPVWYLIANDSGHEIRGTPAEESFLRVLAQFLGSLP